MILYNKYSLTCYPKYFWPAGLSKGYALWFYGISLVSVIKLLHKIVETKRGPHKLRLIGTNAMQSMHRFGQSASLC